MMGSAAGIRFHLKATHGLDDQIIDGLVEMQRVEFGRTNEMQSVAQVHKAMHDAAVVVERVQEALAGNPCTVCGEREAVVILTTARYCRPCALVAGNQIGRDSR